MRNRFGSWSLLLFPLILIFGCGPSSNLVVTTYSGLPIVFLPICDEADVAIAYDDDLGNALAETVKCGTDKIYSIVGSRAGLRGDENCVYLVDIGGEEFRCKSSDRMARPNNNMFAFSLNGRFPAVFLPIESTENVSPKYDKYKEPSGGWDVTYDRTEGNDYISEVMFDYALVGEIIVRQIKQHVLKTQGTVYTIEYSDYHYDDDDNLKGYKAHIKVEKQTT